MTPESCAECVHYLVCHLRKSTALSVCEVQDFCRHFMTIADVKKFPATEPEQAKAPY